MRKLREIKAGRTVFSRIRILSMAAVVAVGSYVSLIPLTAKAADCTDLPSGAGTATVTVNISTDGTYRLWNKLQTATATSDSVLVSVDAQECVKLGDTPLTANTWTWVGHKDGNTATNAMLNLSAGEHTLKLIGVDPGVKVSGMLLLGDENCVPTGSGENCTTVASPDTQAPTVPTNLKAVVTSKTAISLMWTASQEAYAGLTYDVYRKLGTNAAVKVATVGETGFHDSSLTANTTYSYHVIARDAAGNQSAATSVLAAKTLTTNPSGKGKMYGKVTFSPVDASEATISFMVNGALQTHQTDGMGYYFITDIPAGTYIMKFQAGNSYKFAEVKIRNGDTVKDITLPQAPAPLPPAPVTTPFVVANLEQATLASGATLVTESDSSKSVLLTAMANPDPDPDPNPTNGCIANPSSCGYPDATNTGYLPTGVGLTTDGVTLNGDGDLEITQAGTVIDGKLINACVVVKAPNVTIKRSKITNCISYFNIRLYPGSGNFTLEDTEIDGNDFGGQRAALVDDGSGPVTIRRAYMHGLTDGPHGGENWLMEDSFLTNFYACDICHNDGFQSAGALNVTLRHNTIVVTPPDVPPDGGRNAVVRIATEQGPVNGFVVENNLLSGGNFAVQVREQGNGFPQGVKVLNNRIVPDWRMGPIDAGYPELYVPGTIQFTGNYRDDTGAAIPFGYE